MIPDIEGSDTFTGRITHTRNYRRPEEYKDKTVLILGAGPSGTDIASDLSNSACKVGHSKHFIAALRTIRLTIMNYLTGSNNDAFILLYFTCRYTCLITRIT